jgi:geranylgeranyl diphosphate synthase type I
LDIYYESREDLSIEDYWPMIEGKTAALLGACTQIGSIIAGADSQTSEYYSTFGKSLGMAFQVQDDILGIWGNAALTGKSSASDLINGKKSLPVLYGLDRGDAFAQRWALGPIKADDVYEIAEQLEAEGGKSFAQEATVALTDQALNALEKAQPVGEAGLSLSILVKQLLDRQS